MSIDRDGIRDDRVRLMLERMRAGWIVEGDGPEAERLAFHTLGQRFPVPEGVTRQPVDLRGVPAIETSLPDDATAEGPTVLYLHGGAFVIGSAEIYGEQSARLSLASGARVLTIDYRLAPEHPFPAALDDTVCAYRSLLDAGIHAGRIVIAGDSAGGNLALAASKRLRDAGIPLPAGLVLISPWVDLSCASSSMEYNADARHLAQRQGLLRSAATYLGDVDARHPEASPIHGDLSSLPPTLIQVGSLETLLDDSVTLEQELKAAGVQARLHVYEGMVHEWHLLSALLEPDAMLDEAAEAIGEIAAFIREVSIR
ncbi:MAG: alpha/beta hydrolase [Thermomicrobiales bacterium]